MAQSIKEGRTVPERPTRHHKSRPVARAHGRLRPAPLVPRVLLVSSKLCVPAARQGWRRGVLSSECEGEREERPVQDAGVERV